MKRVRFSPFTNGREAGTDHKGTNYVTDVMVWGWWCGWCRWGGGETTLGVHAYNRVALETWSLLSFPREHSRVRPGPRLDLTCTTVFVNKYTHVYIHCF